MFRRKPVPLKFLPNSMNVSIERSDSEVSTAEKSFERSISPKFLQNKFVSSKSNLLRPAKYAIDGKTDALTSTVQMPRANQVPDFASQMRGFKLFKKLKKDSSEVLDEAATRTTLTSAGSKPTKMHISISASIGGLELPCSRFKQLKSPTLKQKMQIAGSLQEDISKMSLSSGIPGASVKLCQIMLFEDFKMNKTRISSEESAKPSSILKMARLRNPKIKPRACSITVDHKEKCESELKDKKVHFSRQIVYYYFKKDN